MAGVGVGSIVLPWLTQSIIDAQGWRIAYRVLGALVLVMGLPLTALFVRENGAGARALSAASGATVRQGLRSRAFWLLVAVLFLSSMSVNGAITHLAPMLTDRGITPDSAALAVSVLGGASLAGRLLTGHLLDRRFGPRVAFVLLAGVAAGIFLLSTVSSTAVSLPAAALIGLGLGGEADVTPYLLTRYFGLRSFSTLYGLTWTAYAIAGATGPVLMGKVFDATKSYSVLLTILSAVTLAASALLLLLPAILLQPEMTLTQTACPPGNNKNVPGGPPSRRRSALESKRSLGIRVSAGLLFGLMVLVSYCGYTAWQLRGLRNLQTEVIDRNRRDSLLLVRIQNSLNMLALGMRDMLDGRDGYPLTAWRNQFLRIRQDLEDAIAVEARVAPVGRTPEQMRYLQGSMEQFWNALDRVFELAAVDEAEARAQVRISLQARQASLSTAVSRLLVQNHDSDEQAAVRTQAIHSQVERNLYLFFAVIVLLLGAMSAYLVIYNRRVFDRVSALSERRSELAQQLIAIQESTFRSISRELHDEFGQILTAVGIMLQRSERLADPVARREELREVQRTVQTTLDKVRTLSQALHPVVLEEAGFESAVDAYLPVFERRTGVAVKCSKSGGPWNVAREQSIHLYRVMQEALNNVARHSGAKEAEVRLALIGDQLTLEVEDAGIGFRNRNRDGLGLVSMRERAEIAGGRIEFLEGARGGALVRFAVPAVREEARAGSQV